MRAFLIGFLLLATVHTAFADYPPFEGPYDRDDNHAADVIASSAAWLPALAAGSACGVVALPVDAYWKIAHPEDAFGSRFGNKTCTYPLVAVAASIYVVVGLPAFAVQNLLGTYSFRPGSVQEESV